MIYRFGLLSIRYIASFTSYSFYIVIIVNILHYYFFKYLVNSTSEWKLFNLALTIFHLIFIIVVRNPKLFVNDYISEDIYTGLDQPVYPDM